MRSMTGYGKGEVNANGNRVQIEITAVNSRKQSDLRFAMPRELGPLEPFLRRVVQKHIARGSITITVTYDLNIDIRKGLVRIDMELARHLAHQLREVANEAGVDATIGISDLIALPGVVGEEMASPCEPLRELAVQALKQAILNLREMQETEGAELYNDLRQRCETLRKLVCRIEARKDDALRNQKKRLLERIRLLDLQDINDDDERLLKEVAFCAEKSDITEEIVRLKSHITQLAERLDEQGEIGRALEFLCQEMNREITTICAKTSDTQSAITALALKNEVGRVREQVMNIE